MYQYCQALIKQKELKVFTLPALCGISQVYQQTLNFMFSQGGRVWRPAACELTLKMTAPVETCLTVKVLWRSGQVQLLLKLKSEYVCIHFPCVRRKTSKKVIQHQHKLKPGDSYSHLWMNLIWVSHFPLLGWCMQINSTQACILIQATPTCHNMFPHR